MAIAAMGERYGDRLVGQLAQAGGMIENGLKAVTTMKELQSLGQNLSQISPESPDYQQQLMQLGASHPFAMQDPRGQALVSMGNQQHLQWKNQQFAMQQADRQEARADRRDAMSDRRQGMRDANAYRIAQLRYGAGGDELDPLTEVTPQPGFSRSVGLSIDQTQEAADDNATNLPVDLRMPGDDMSDLQIPASLTRRGISMEDWQDTASRIPSVTDPEAQVERTAPRDLTEAEMLNNWVAAGERVIGGTPNAKIRTGLVKQFGGIGAKKEAVLASNDFRREMFDKTQAAKGDYANTQAEISALKAQQSHEYRLAEMSARNAMKQAAAKLKADGTLTTVQDRKLKSLQKEMDNSVEMADLLLLKLREAEKTGVEREAIQAQATEARLAAQEATAAFEQYTQEIGGGSTEKIIVISPDGQKGYIPKSQLESALKRGYKQQ